ncbi:hypothetical protein BJY04DRAFT_211280 [Aspergillus karnatakaensis]|uniref:putative R3H and G-patch domain protein n=1 Tax=Aspergillus karnatakaensis TaxID=1810916 RepID=UPI003CCDD488
MARFNKAKARKGGKNTCAGRQRSMLSMQQEARNTEGRNLWRSSVQLRHQVVKFVSAGNTQPAQELNQELELKQESQNAQNTDSERISPTERRRDMSTADGPGSSPGSNISHRTTLNLTPPAGSSYSSPGESSEDEIVFRGRRTEKASNSRANPQKDITRDGIIEKEIYIGSPASSLHEASIASEREYISWVPINGKDASQNHEITDEDDILADYIANIDNDSDDEHAFTSDEEQSNENDHMTSFQAAISKHPACDSAGEDYQSDLPNMSLREELEDEPRHAVSAQSHSAEKNSGESIFASATAFADALDSDPYYDFDIMDVGRSSLKTKKKKHQHPKLEALDSDLETELINAWTNDRLKKKSKKKEREELRAQGLLGRRKNDPNLKEKYSDGLSFEELKTEICSFLLSSKNSLSLPPMTKHRRMLIHDMAHALCLTSQSRGKGSSRFPILSKTLRTVKYTHKTISQIDRVFTKERFSPRALKPWGKSGNRTAKAKRGHGNVSYMDGDVVGASAPEIGLENKGRAMLEKMGWSTGTALGAINNKGILLPVAHVVKNSKAGLG